MTPPQFCESCGKPLVPGSRFCEECGQVVEGGAVTAASPVSSPPPSVVMPPPPSVAPPMASPVAFPAVAAPVLPSAGGSLLKALLGVAGVVVLSGLGFLVSPVGKQLMARVSGKLHAASSQATPLPGQAKAAPDLTAKTVVSAPSSPADDFTTPATDIKPVDLAPDISPTPAATPEDQKVAAAQQWVDRGYAAEQAGNVKEALAAYEQALTMTNDRKLATHIQQLKKTSSSVAVPEPAPEPEPVPASVRVTPQMAQAAAILHATGNTAAVLNGATHANTFVVAEPMVVTSIMTYHWNNAKGKVPGVISLEHEDGTQYGGWQAKGGDGQGGVPNASWNVAPGVVLKPGKYTLLDSHPASWSQNAATGGKGMCEIKGLPWRQVGGVR